VARSAIRGFSDNLRRDPERGILSEGTHSASSRSIAPRAVLIYALMGIYWMWSDAEVGTSRITRRWLKAWSLKIFRHKHLG